MRSWVVGSYAMHFMGLLWLESDVLVPSVRSTLRYSC
jgi:hypothetical protein